MSQVWQWWWIAFKLLNVLTPKSWFILNFIQWSIYKPPLSEERSWSNSFIHAMDYTTSSLLIQTMMTSFKRCFSLLPWGPEMVLIVVASAALLIISLSVAFWCSVEHEKSNHLILNDPNKIAYEHVGVYVKRCPFRWICWGVANSWESFGRSPWISLKTFRRPLWFSSHKTAFFFEKWLDLLTR